LGGQNRNLRAKAARVPGRGREGGSGSGQVREDHLEIEGSRGMWLASRPDAYELLGGKCLWHCFHRSEAGIKTALRFQAGV
jgi:hypothetical protein